MICNGISHATSASHFTGRISRRKLIAVPGCTALFVLLGTTCKSASLDDGALTPEAFGAKGDGRTNDSAAFARLADRINRDGGGTIMLRRTTYIVGKQQRMATVPDRFSFRPEKLLEISGCTRPVRILGNGARLRCAAGLRYGTFDAATGQAHFHDMPYAAPSERATPYESMILIEKCSGPVEIRDLELDGNLGEMIIGGRYGDKGWQIPASGLRLRDNSGPEFVRNLYTHHHGQDGVYLDGADMDRKSGGRFENVRAQYNGRQGVSAVGGRDYAFADCDFSHTGKADLFSPPGAGVDIEAHRGKQVRRLTFDRCRFADNSGVGMVADSGNSANVTFRDCRFLATSAWGVWPQKPYFAFERCKFVGSIVRCFSDPTGEQATRFTDCLFTDVPDDSLRQPAYLPRENGPIADLASAQGMLFDKCRFVLRHGAVLPWSKYAIYRDCTMQQRAAKKGKPRGTYRGTTVISGPVVLSGSRFEGDLIVNGTRVARTGI